MCRHHGHGYKAMVRRLLLVQHAGSKVYFSKDLDRRKVFCTVHSCISHVANYERDLPFLPSRRVSFHTWMKRLYTGRRSFGGRSPLNSFALLFLGRYFLRIRVGGRSMRMPLRTSRPRLARRTRSLPLWRPRSPCCAMMCADAA